MPHCLRVCQSKSAAVYHLENSVFFVRIPHVPPSLPLSPPTYRTTRGENLGQALYRNRLPHCSFNPTKMTFQVAGPFPFLQLHLISPTRLLWTKKNRLLSGSKWPLCRHIHDLPHVSSVSLWLGSEIMVCKIFNQSQSIITNLTSDIGSMLPNMNERTASTI
jgi:hypothetical protein